MSERRSVSAAAKEFNKEIEKLCRLDDQNQARYFAGPGRPSVARLSAGQMHLLTEAILARAFSHYEVLLEETFILYTRGKKTRGGNKVKTFINPKNASHARDILKAGMTFLDWNSADKIITRCETYLGDDNPIHLAVSTHRDRLENIRKTRNAIAHKSVEADRKYRIVIRNELGTLPLSDVPVGKFLLTRNPNAFDNETFLRSYIRTLVEVAEVATN